jgi:hypothetical protein
MDCYYYFIFAFLPSSNLTWPKIVDYAYGSSVTFQLVRVADSIAAFCVFLKIQDAYFFQSNPAAIIIFFFLCYSNGWDN